MTDLRQEFERIRTRLIETGKTASSEGAYARAMLELMPPFIAHVERSQKANVPPMQFSDGVSNAIANMLVQTVQHCFEQSSQPEALRNILRHIKRQAVPKVGKTAGGIILPAGHA